MYRIGSFILLASAAEAPQPEAVHIFQCFAGMKSNHKRLGSSWFIQHKDQDVISYGMSGVWMDSKYGVIKTLYSVREQNFLDSKVDKDKF